LSTSVTIRAAWKEECAAITALIEELARAEGNPRVVDGAALEAALFGKDRPATLCALVATQGETVVATVLYYPGYDVLTTSAGYHLADIVVTEPFRRQGIARRLFAALAQQNLAAGGEWISLTVLRSNAAAQGFYAALGLVQVAVDFFAAGPRQLMRIAATVAELPLAAHGSFATE